MRNVVTRERWEGPKTRHWQLHGGWRIEGDVILPLRQGESEDECDLQVGYLGDGGVSWIEECNAMVRFVLEEVWESKVW